MSLGVSGTTVLRIEGHQRQWTFQKVPDSAVCGEQVHRDDEVEQIVHSGCVSAADDVNFQVLIIRNIDMYTKFDVYSGGFRGKEVASIDLQELFR